MKKLYLLGACLVVLSLVVLSLPGCTRSTLTPTPTSALVSFAGKSIIMVVPTSAGGGTDLIARVYATYLPKFLPGKPTMIVRNVPGAGATIGASYVYTSKPDGLTVLATPSEVTMAYATGASGVHYDLKKMQAVMSTSEGSYYYTKAGIVNKAEDLLKAKGIIFGGTMGASSYIFIALTKLVDMHPEKVIMAYTGGADARRAFYAGETNLTVESITSYAQTTSAYIAKGEVTPLFQSGIVNMEGDIVRDSVLPLDIPTGKELYEKIYGKPPSGIAWDAYKVLVSAGRCYGDALLLPPDTPDSIVRAYWDAAEKMIKDPQFQKAVESMSGPNRRIMAGEALAKQFIASMAMDPKVVDWIRSALKEWGVVI